MVAYNQWQRNPSQSFQSMGNSTRTATNPRNLIGTCKEIGKGGKGNRRHATAAMKIHLGSVQDKLRIYDALKKAMTNGRNIDFEFRNQVSQTQEPSHVHAEATKKHPLVLGRGPMANPKDQEKGGSHPQTSARTANRNRKSQYSQETKVRGSKRNICTRRKPLLWFR